MTSQHGSVGLSQLHHVPKLATMLKGKLSNFSNAGVRNVNLSEQFTIVTGMGS